MHHSCGVSYVHNREAILEGYMSSLICQGKIADKRKKKVAISYLGKVTPSAWVFCRPGFARWIRLRASTPGRRSGSIRRQRRADHPDHSNNCLFLVVIVHVSSVSVEISVQRVFESLVRLLHVERQLPNLVIAQLLCCAHLIKRNEPLDDLSTRVEILVCDLVD